MPAPEFRIRGRSSSGGSPSRRSAPRSGAAAGRTGYGSSSAWRPAPPASFWCDPMNLARHRLDEKPLSAPRQLALVARSFFLQSAWSFERMQSVGFAALMAGEGRRLTRGRPDAARDYLLRHLTFFNTNPPMA